jgi:hypothetical protein
MVSQQSMDWDRECTRSKTLEEAAKVLDRQAESYFSQMEGQGMPEFGQLEFAMGACRHVAKVLRSMRTEGSY